MSHLLLFEIINFLTASFLNTIIYILLTAMIPHRGISNQCEKCRISGILLCET